MSQHECLGFRTAKTNVWVLHKGDESLEIAVGGRFQLNSVGLIRRLATLDQGIAILPAEIVADDVAQGHLRRILADWEGPATPVYTMTETQPAAGQDTAFHRVPARTAQCPYARMTVSTAQ